MSSISDNNNYPDRPSFKTGAEKPAVLFRAVASGRQLKMKLILVVFAFLLSFLLLFPYLLHALAGNYSFASRDEVTAVLLASGFCLPFAIILYKTIKHNQVIITADTIFMHLGVRAISITIPVEELQGYCLERHTSRAGTSFNFVFWYKNGVQARSGSLYLNNDDVEEIADLLENRLNLPVLKGWEIISRGGLIYKENTGAGINKRTNYISLLITIACFAAVLISVYFLYIHRH